MRVNQFPEFSKALGIHFLRELVRLRWTKCSSRNSNGLRNSVCAVQFDAMFKMCKCLMRKDLHFTLNLTNIKTCVTVYDSWKILFENANDHSLATPNGTNPSENNPASCNRDERTFAGAKSVVETNDRAQSRERAGHYESSGRFPVSPRRRGWRASSDNYPPPLPPSLGNGAGSTLKKQLHLSRIRHAQEAPSLVICWPIITRDVMIMSLLLPGNVFPLDGD